MTTTPHADLQIAAFAERMNVSMVAASKVLSRFANEVSRAFAVPIFLVAPEWERPVDRARRLRVERAGRAYQRRAARRDARARRRAALGSAA